MNGHEWAALIEQKPEDPQQKAMRELRETLFPKGKAAAAEGWGWEMRNPL